jgi:hypothetical protein
MKRIAFALLAFMAPGCANRDSGVMRELLAPTLDTGSAPDQAAALAAIEADLRLKLKDPESAMFSWPNRMRPSIYKPPLGGAVAGWAACGTVNARNSYGGFTGPEPVIGIVNNGQVVLTKIDEGRYSLIADWCAKAGMPVGPH